MAVDVSPELLEDVEKRFRYYLNKNREISAAMRALSDGSADYETAYKYARALGEVLADAFADTITEERLPNGKMYYNIADKVVRPMLYKVQDMAAAYSDGVQRLINERAGIGLNPVEVYEH